MPDPSDFSERLKAMREGKSGQPGLPSLKALKPIAQPPAATRPAKPELDFKSRIQAKFQQKDTPSPAPPELEVTNPDAVTQKQTPKEKQDTLWSLENGGICPSCQLMNNSGIVFCIHCRFMLLRSEQELEIVTSYPLSEIKGLVSTFVESLARLNICTTQDMLRIGLSPRNRQILLKHTKLSERSLVRLVHQCDFCRVPSMGPETAMLLELLGINTMADFLKQNPLELYNKIQQARVKLNLNGIVYIPTRSKVNTWFEEARQLVSIRLS